MIKLFNGELGCNLATGGLLLQHPDGSETRLFARLTMILQDGAAHKYVFSVKGDAGTKFCFLCRNCISKRSSISDDSGDLLLVSSELRYEDLDLATDQDIRGSLLRLVRAHGHLNQANFQLLQQAIGFTYDGHAMMFDPSLFQVLQPVQQYCHDFMHCLFVHGVFQTVVTLLIAAVSTKIRGVQEQLQDYMKAWNYPKRYSTSGLSHVFAMKKGQDGVKRIKCTASEGLGVFSVLAFWVQAVLLPSEACVPEAMAFVALANVIELLMAVAANKTSPEYLLERIHVFLERCAAAEWKGHMVSKFHWLLHLPDHLSRFGCLPACWVQERKHRVVKRYGQDVRNTNVYERSIISEITCHDLAALESTEAFLFGVSLEQPKVANAATVAFFQQFFVSSIGNKIFICSSARILPTGICCKNDVALFVQGDSFARNSFDLAAGKTLLHVEILGTCFTLVFAWQVVEYDAATRSLTCEQTESLMLVRTDEIVGVALWTQRSQRASRLLVPWAVYQNPFA